MFETVNFDAPQDAMDHIPPGHDSWTVGEEPVRFLDFNPSR
jgi:hypothetical protein